MAIMIPLEKNSDNFNNSKAEWTTYNVLRQGLSDDYIVLHSVDWRTSDEREHEKNGESDFLVFNPRYGFLAIEVKGGGIRKTIDNQWWTTNRYGNEHKLKKSPMKQAWESANYFNDKIKESHNQNAKRYRVRPVVWFSNLHEKEVSFAYGEDFRPNNTFNRDDFKDPEAAIKRAYKYYNLEEQNVTLTNQEISSIVSLFSSAFDIAVKIIMSEAERNRIMFNRLTKEQAQLLDYIDQIHSARIEGVGGTGKTMLALERARRINPDEKVLFLCFNVFLLNSLKTNHSASMPNVTFTNLNRLYAKTTGQSEYTDKETITAFLKSYFDYNFDFKHIIIDEGQDFEASHLEELKKVSQKLGGYFYIFYDENQLVHQWRTDTLDWFESSDLPKLHLNLNCRNTKSIAKTAYRPVEINDIKLAEDIIGNKPIMKITDDPDMILKLIGETIRGYTDKGLNKKQIVILTLKTIAKSILSGRDSVEGYRLSVDDPNGDNILFTTSRKFKGLEADAIIIIDVDEECFKDNNAKSVFYVAASRATSELTIIANLDRAKMSGLVTALGISSSGSPKRLLEEALSVEIINHINNDNVIDHESTNDTSYTKEDIKQWLKSIAVKTDPENVTKAIQKTINKDYDDRRLALEAFVLNYLEAKHGLYAINVMEMSKFIVNEKNLPSSSRHALRTYLSNCLQNKTIIMDVIGIGKPNHYIINPDKNS